MLSCRCATAGLQMPHRHSVQLSLSQLQAGAYCTHCMARTGCVQLHGLAVLSGLSSASLSNVTAWAETTGCRGLASSDVW